MATGSQSELSLFLGLERGVPPGDLQRKKIYYLPSLILCLAI